MDDLMITRRDDDIFMVVNAACKEQDIAHMRASLPDGLELTELTDRALVALQGPEAAAVTARFVTGADTMDFMSYMEAEIAGVPCFISRCGYTGEDRDEDELERRRACHPLSEIRAFPLSPFANPCATPTMISQKMYLFFPSGPEPNQNL